jgi:hypothetical protein
MKVSFPTFVVFTLSIAAATAQPLSSDHVIVPGERIGNAELDPADQGSLVRNLGEPDETEQQGDRATYRYGATGPDGAPDELIVTFDLSKDAPFEIATASPAYHTRGDLSVGSSDTAIRAALGPPLCAGDDGAGHGIIVYDTIWFRTVQGKVVRVAIRKQLSLDDFKTGAAHC